MMYRYSSANCLFYPYALKDAYKKTGSWPEKGVDVDESVWEEYIQSPPSGMTRGVDENGYPAWVKIHS